MVGMSNHHCQKLVPYLNKMIIEHENSLRLEFSRLASKLTVLFTHLRSRMRHSPADELVRDYQILCAFMASCTSELSAAVFWEKVIFYPNGIHKEPALI